MTAPTGRACFSVCARAGEVLVRQLVPWLDATLTANIPPICFNVYSVFNYKLALPKHPFNGYFVSNHSLIFSYNSDKHPNECLQKIYWLLSLATLQLGNKSKYDHLYFDPSIPQARYLHLQKHPTTRAKNIP